MYHDQNILFNINLIIKGKIMKIHSSRRSFIKKTGAAALGFAIVPRHVLGQGMIPPSDQLNVAVIGGGGKGYSDAINVWNNHASHIAAICDVDWNMRLPSSFPRPAR